MYFNVSPLPRTRSMPVGTEQGEAQYSLLVGLRKRDETKQWATSYILV